MAKKGFNTILQRTITGAIFIAVIIAALLYSAYLSFIVFAIAMYFCFIEFLNVTSNNAFNKARLYLLKLLAMCLYTASYFYAIGIIDISLLFWIVPAFILIGIIELFNKTGDTMRNVSTTVMGLIYIVLPFSLVHIMINDNGEFNGVILLIVFILIWANDSFAYLFGVAFGKHRLWERISPKKSWEGFIGGGLTTIIVSWLIAKFFFPELFAEMIGLSAIVVVFGTMGDLFESQLKRQFNVKDAGESLPGHGGFLDRFDSFLFIIPLAIIYLQIISR